MAAIFGGLDQDAYDRQYTDGYLMRRIISYFARYRGKLIAIALGFIGVAIFNALPPILVAEGVDQLDLEGGSDVIIVLVGALIVAAFLQYGSNWIRRYLMSVVIGNVIAQLRKDAFAAAVDRDLAFYDKQKSGKIVSRITSDTQEFGDVVLITSDVFAQLLQVFVLLAVLFTRSVSLTFILLLMLPLIVGAAMGFRALARVVTRQGARAMAMVNDTIQESVTGISVAKNFRKEKMIYGEFTEINYKSYRINMKRGFVLALIFPVLNILAGFAIAVILFVGAQYVVWGMVNVGSWFLFIQGVDRFWFPFINLSAVWSQFQQALSATERIFALIDAGNTVKQTDNRQPENLRGKVEIKDVTFAYEVDQPILQNFNLSIAEGEDVAFVGHTGAGKSTIAKLITRFYEFQAGDVLIDGQDIRTFDLPAFRSKLGIVPQQPFLFSGTVRDNIRYSRPNATDDEIREVAYSVGNGEWLEGLPEGLDTDVGERGAHLSMGQRQLVSLMRVLLEKPVIFILDEATASVDPFTEAQIQEALDLILKHSTSILIAHRLSTIRNADRIIVLKDGEIIEQGSHDQLMAGGGHYAELYNTYFRHQSLNYIENAKSMFDRAAGD
ncbi:MAG: ABC transporter ATP-binding protein [Anaerolineaceae bacterium]|nr:MAG: ABC transporter ATP-binding protein [Anaerolineaceae bacterium]